MQGVVISGPLYDAFRDWCMTAEAERLVECYKDLLVYSDTL